ncbi:hypothetical protein [Isoptericola dokdonensis]|uniref:Uncharacterized protein n=1 Tax=Isoptericola dokdonensis DS-3 TaxID=1300344 RepID=A0A168FDL1_9MICO|nr:hypothetical protein [Isoptericola dokdonensis]ANC31449.1 hypothetical protein I598_1901 [Isoptericola dokdonensis DS-3]
MGTRRRTPWGSTPDSIEQVPLRDCAEEAPAAQRRDARVTRPDDPPAIRVWLTARQTGEFEADGHATAWTDRQVHVRYLDPHGREGFAWVWASAVSRR